ncbi:MAG TPA: septum formation initiator family protein [Blastocatellia bacterium]|nr:septum formation initiator family protein [Blastocatellia bacterium]
MRRARNSFSVRRSRPAAVPARRRAVAINAAMMSPWAAPARPVAATSAQTTGFRVPFAPVLIMILLAIGGLAISVVARSRHELRDAKAHNTLVKQQVDDLSDEIHRLADENAAMDSNPQVIERLAREHLGLIRPGELTADAKK